MPSRVIHWLYHRGTKKRSSATSLTSIKCKPTIVRRDKTDETDLVRWCSWCNDLWTKDYRLHTGFVCNLQHFNHILSSTVIKKKKHSLLLFCQLVRINFDVYDLRWIFLATAHHESVRWSSHFDYQVRQGQFMSLHSIYVEQSIHKTGSSSTACPDDNASYN
jgi:hypothetical protein